MTNSKKPILIPRQEVTNAIQPGPIDVSHNADAPIAQSSRRQKLFQPKPVIAEVSNRMFRPPELRKATRYQLTSTAVIRWLGADQQLHEAEGVVRDISTCGVFVESPAPLLLRTNVELEITQFRMQPGSICPGLHFEGRVVRTEKNRKRLGFAVAGFLYVSAPGDARH